MNFAGRIVDNFPPTKGYFWSFYATKKDRLTLKLVIYSPLRS